MGRRWPLGVVTMMVLSAATTVVAPDAAADPAIGGTYNSVPVRRIVNTTTGTGAPRTALGAGRTLTFDGLADLSGLGAGSASAVDLTVTVIAPTRTGYLTAYSGPVRPGVATLTFTAGESTPGNAAVGVGDDGTVHVYNGSPGTVDVAVDRHGFWTGGEVAADTIGAYRPRTPVRVADSRRSTTPIAGHGTVHVPGSALGLPASVRALRLVLGAVTPRRAGYLFAYDRDAARKLESTTVSFAAERSRTNLTVVRLDDDGGFSLYNGSPGPVHYTVDVVGYYVNGAGTTRNGSTEFFQTRRADSRGGPGPIPAGGTRIVNVETSSATEAVTVVVTAFGATAPGFLSAGISGRPRPNTSVTNFATNTTRTGTVTVEAADTLALYNGSSRPVSYTVDVVAFVYGFDPFDPDT